MSRLISSIFCENGVAYQTTEYFQTRPLGSIKQLIEINDRHAVDEIFISSRRNHNSGPDLTCLEEIRSSSAATPITYCGGICGTSDVRLALESGADRIGISTILHKPYETREIIKYIGAQGVIGVLPLNSKDKNTPLYVPALNKFTNITASFLKYIAEIKIELLLIDIQNDGKHNLFNTDLINFFPHNDLILQGGCLHLKPKDINLHANISGLAFENILTWQEHNAIKIRKNHPLIHKRGLHLD